MKKMVKKSMVKAQKGYSVGDKALIRTKAAVIKGIENAVPLLKGSRTAQQENVLKNDANLAKNRANAKKVAANKAKTTVNKNKVAVNKISVSAKKSGLNYKK